ncbi:MAG: hypothetical protein ACXVCY_15000 [Pseudobdellovibrionaceae bacterium]
MRRARKQELESYQNTLNALQEKENRTYDRFDSGEIDRETYNQQRTRIQGEQRDFSLRMAKAQIAIDDISNETVRSILQLVTNAETLWNRRSADEKREFLEKILFNQTFDGVSV